MNPDQAQLLRDRWGNKPCDHPGFVREYDKGMQGDFICTQCGRESLTDSPSGVIGEKRKEKIPE